MLKSIVYKLLIPVVLFVLVMAGFAGFSIHLNHLQKRDGLAINIAGRQRMLSQRVLKIYFFLYESKKMTGVFPEKDFIKLKNAIALFELSHQALLKGGATYKNINLTGKVDLQPIVNTQIHGLLTEVTGYWGSLNTALNKGIQADFKVNGGNFKEMESLTDKILGKMHKTTGLFQKIAEKKLKQGLYLQISLLFFVLVGAFSLFYQIRKNIVSPVLILRRNIGKLKEGKINLLFQDKYLNLKDEIGVLMREYKDFITSHWDLISTLRDGVNQSQDQSTQLSNASIENLTQVSKIQKNNVAMSDSMETMLNKLSQVTESEENLRSIQTSIGTSISENLEMMKSLDKAIQGQSSSMEQMAASIEEFNGNIISMSKITINAESYTDQLNQIAKENNERFETIIKDMNELILATDKIKNFTDVITSLASSTNLLSMNASIEAAHAGEQGKGFAVVADEIRKLSNLSSEQAETAQVDLEGIQNKVNEFSNILMQSKEEFTKAGKLTHSVSDITRQIKNGMVEQETGTKEMVSAINEVQLNTQTMVKQSQFSKSQVDRLKIETGNLDENASILNSSVNEMSTITQGFKGQLNEISTTMKSVSELGDLLNVISKKNKDFSQSLHEMTAIYHIENEKETATTVAIPAK